MDNILENRVDSLMYNGIDVSRYQGSIDWNRVKLTQQFAFIRLGWAGYDGSITKDERFDENMRLTSQNDIAVGVYVYSYCNSTNSAIMAAKKTLELVTPYKLTYPVAFDIEDNMYIKRSKVENSVIAMSFLNEIEKNKYYAMLYTYTNFANNYLDMSMLNKFDLWIADYRSELGYNGNYGIWQYTSNGIVDGISTNVDKNYSYKNYPEIIRLAGLNKLSPILEQKYYGVNVIDIKERETAYDISTALKLMNLYNEVKFIDNMYVVQVFSFSKRERADEIALSITTITGIKSEVVNR